MSKLAEIQARREARRAELQDQADAQKAEDLAAIIEIEDANPNGTRLLEIDYVPGLPCTVLIRAPKPGEIKRYHSRLQAKVDRGRVEPGDAIKAAEELATLCVVYPDRETLDKLADARPGLLASAGQEAVDLAQARAVAEGKG